MGKHHRESVAIQKSQPPASIAFFIAPCMNQYWQSTVIGDPQNPTQSGIGPVVAVRMQFDSTVWIGLQWFSQSGVSPQEFLRHPQKRCSFQLRNLHQLRNIPHSFFVSLNCR